MTNIHFFQFLMITLAQHRSKGIYGCCFNKISRNCKVKGGVRTNQGKVILRVLEKKKKDIS